MKRALALSQSPCDKDIPVYIVISKNRTPLGALQTEWHCETQTVEEIEEEYGETLAFIFTIKNLKDFNKISHLCSSVRYLKNILKTEDFNYYRTKKGTEQRLLEKQKELRQILEEWKKEGILFYGDYEELLKKVKVTYKKEPMYKEIKIND